MTSTLFLTLACLFPREHPAEDKANADDFKAIQGEWRIVVADHGGAWLTGYGELAMYLRRLKVTVTDKRIVIEPHKEEPRAAMIFAYIWEYGYVIDPTKLPKEIDFFKVFTARETDDVLRGIYDLQGDRLTICFHHSPESIRPKEFYTSKGDDRIIWLFERVREKKK